MIAIRFQMPLFPGEDVQPGDRWFVESLDQAAGTVTFARATPEPDQYRSPRDGLHPRVTLGTRPISDEEAKALADEMDAAMAAGRDRLEAWPFSPDNPFNAVGTLEPLPEG